jgi:hypothetical protein
MPAAASDSASILYELFLPGRSVELPFRSVGPDPAMMRTIGTLSAPGGTTSAPRIVPVAVAISTCSVTGCEVGNALPAPAICQIRIERSDSVSAVIRLSLRVRRPVYEVLAAYMPARPNLALRCLIGRSEAP